MIDAVALSLFRFGHDYPDADINSRVAGREAEIAQLAAAIKAEGLLQPLLAVEAPRKDCYYVIDGNRRLAALRMLADAGDLPADHLTPFLRLDDEASPLDALRKSLIANDARLPLHPVDRYAAFAQCHEGGDSPAEIAARYAIPERAVRQSLALGRLAPVIRSAWRTGEIDAQKAQAFTLGGDHEAQARAFAKLKKENKLRSWSIRQHFIGSDGETSRLLPFVGREAYEAAGGSVIVDLFSREESEDEEAEGGDGVSNYALLQKLADDKLRATCAELVEEGWAWASPASELPSNANYAWERLPDIRGKKASAEKKAKSGCIVDLDYAGNLDITYGVVKPEGKSAKDAKKKKDKAAKTGHTEPAEETAIPYALKLDLIEQRTRAAAEAAATDIDVGLSLLLAGFMSDGMCGIHVRSSGLLNNSEESEELQDALAMALKIPRADKLKALAVIAGQSLDFRSADDEASAAICAALPAEALNDALARSFAAADYFDRAPKAVTLAAIEEVMGADAVKPLATKKKADIAAFAAKELPAKGWLPPELRTAHYAGTAARTAKKKPAPPPPPRSKRKRK